MSQDKFVQFFTKMCHMFHLSSIRTSDNIKVHEYIYTRVRNVKQMLSDNILSTSIATLLLSSFSSLPKTAPLLKQNIP